MKLLLLILVIGLALAGAQAPPRTRSQTTEVLPAGPALPPVPLSDNDLARLALLSVVMVETHQNVRVQDLVVRTVPFSSPSRREEILSPARDLQSLADILPTQPLFQAATELTVISQKLVASGSGWVIRACELSDGRLPGEADFTLLITNRHVIAPILNTTAPVTTTFPSGTGRVYPPPAYVLEPVTGTYRLVPDPEAACTEVGLCRQYTVSGGVAFVRFNTGRLFGLDRNEASEPALAQVVFVQGNRDIALLKVPGVCGVPTLPWGDDYALRTGDRVYLAGASLGFPFSWSSGEFQGTISIPPVIEEALRHTASANPGSSGGPLLTVQAGRLVVVGQERFGFLTPVGAYGLTFAQGENGATRASQLRQVLFVSGYGYASGMLARP